MHYGGEAERREVEDAFDRWGPPVGGRKERREGGGRWNGLAGLTGPSGGMWAGRGKEKREREKKRAWLGWKEGKRERKREMEMGCGLFFSIKRVLHLALLLLPRSTILLEVRLVLDRYHMAAPVLFLTLLSAVLSMPHSSFKPFSAPCMWLFEMKFP
jgi:hypothetical protein